MPIKMLNGPGDPLTFCHARTGSQNNRVTQLSASNRRVGLVGIAPGCTPVDERLKLPRHIRPIGRGYQHNPVRLLKLAHQPLHIVPLDAFRGIVAGPAPFAEANLIVVDAGRFHLIPRPQAFGHNIYRRSRGPVFYRTAIHHQRSHCTPSVRHIFSIIPQPSLCYKAQNGHLSLDAPSHFR